MASILFTVGFAFPQIELPSGGDQPSDDPIEPRGRPPFIPPPGARQASTCGKLKIEMNLIFYNLI